MPAEEKYWLPEEQREEQSYQLNTERLSKTVYSACYGIMRTAGTAVFLSLYGKIGEDIFMKRFHSVKKNTDFQKAYQAAKSFATKELVMYVRENDLAYNRLGVSCSKKVGNSVVRHTMTRKFREIFRLNDKQLNQGLDIILVVRKGADAVTYNKLESAYLYLCGRHHIVAAASSQQELK